MFVPVVDQNQNPLMPTTSSRARKWIKSKKATPFWKKGIFCVRLNAEPSDTVKQQIAVGVDPGSKKEGFTVKSAAHTYLNVQADAVIWVKDAVEVRRNMRQQRRFRKTPYRKNKFNRSSLKKNRIPPSTKARWGWKLRIINWFFKMYPISNTIVEDIKAKTKPGQRKWNKFFSPLEVGKNWFYDELRKISKFETKQGYETKILRDKFGLKKNEYKLSNSFDAHCVDSWVLANSVTGGHMKSYNESMLLISPIRLHRRQLHKFQPGPMGVRESYGSTKSMSLKRGALVKHKKRGITYVGGSFNDRVGLISKCGKRLCHNAKVFDIKFLSYNTYKIYNIEDK